MKNHLPPEEIEFYTNTTEEKRLVLLQNQFRLFDKSIWGTDDCERCGVCCYKYTIEELGKEEQYTLCDNLKIEDNIPYCDTQNKKPETCKDYGCYKGRGSPVERWQMIQIAEKILKTKTKADLEELAKTHILTYDEIEQIRKTRREEEFKKFSPEKQARIKKNIRDLLELD